MARTAHAKGESYRGYLIMVSFATGMFYVSKDGTHVYTGKSLEEAKRGIDAILDLILSDAPLE